MSEGSYCQHRALKPADFKWNSPSCGGLHHGGDWATFPGWTACRDMGWSTTHSWAHCPARSPSTRQPEPSVPICPRPSLLWRRGEKCSGDHYLGIKCKPKPNNKKSNQHKVGKHCQPSVMLFCLVSCERVSLALQVRHRWAGFSWLFQGIHVNKALPLAR